LQAGSIAAMRARAVLALVKTSIGLLKRLKPLPIYLIV
jgi:hypothetical protein